MEVINICFKLEAVWQNDNDVTHCTKCKAPFSLIFNRKHHCYVHGAVCCANCVTKRIDIYVDALGDRYLDIIPYRNNSTIKVCDMCYNLLKTKQGRCMLASNNLLYFDYLRRLHSFRHLQIMEYNHQKLPNIYFNFRNQLPTQSFTSLQINTLLKINSSFFAGHSSWLIPLFKSYPATNPKLLSLPQTKSCDSLKCPHACYSKLKSWHLLDLLLNSNCRPEVLTYIYTQLDVLSDTEFDIYIPQFTKLTTKYPSFLDYLVSRSNTSIQIASSCYFQLLVNNNVSSTFNSKLSHDLLLKLNIMRDTADIIRKSNFDSLDTKFKHIIYEPVHPEEKFCGIDVKNIKDIPSYNAPKLIPFVTATGKIHNILYKSNDSLRHDEIISRIIMIFDRILIDEEKLDCYTVKYRVVALDTRSGLIEIVPNSETLETLKRIHNFSIQNYVRINNKNMKFEGMGLSALSSRVLSIVFSPIYLGLEIAIWAIL